MHGTKIRKRKPETEDQFIRRIDRTIHRMGKNGGPTYAEILRAFEIKNRRKAEASKARGE